MVIAWVLVGATDARGVDEMQRTREFFVDPPTLHNLGFRWYIYGDDNGDAVGTLQFRQVGKEAWKLALPMRRVNREVTNWDFKPYACENLLAGSIFGLSPDTTYEVRCQVSDPDGGVADTMVTARTRCVPEPPSPLRTLHLYATQAGSRAGYTNLTEAAAGLEPGDLLLIHAGVHRAGPEATRIPSGTSEAPIVLRGAGDGVAVIEADSADTLFDVRESDYLFFEDLHLKGPDFVFRAGGASWLTVRRCRMTDTRMGLYSYSEHSTNWYIADNVIIGRNMAWYPRKEGPSHTGINFYGRGHVVCYNRVSDFWDCIAVANYGKPAHDLELQAVAIDIYGNDLSEAIDDAIESDYGCHNIRIYENRIRNAHTALSAQPTYGGPIYFIRNVAYGITSLNLKLHNWCAGLEIYHNTLVSARIGFRSYYRWQNASLVNNLILGRSGYAVDTGSHHPRVVLDHNGYRRADPVVFIKWFDGEDRVRYPSLESSHAATGFEAHGIEVDFSAFRQASAPEEGATYAADAADLRLEPDAPVVDAGAVLPNINDGYTGRAPDVGCYERGVPEPHYGPRLPIVGLNGEERHR